MWSSSFPWLFGAASSFPPSLLKFTPFYLENYPAWTSGEGTLSSLVAPEGCGGYFLLTGGQILGLLALLCSHVHSHLSHISVFILHGNDPLQSVSQWLMTVASPLSPSSHALFSSTMCWYSSVSSLIPAAVFLGVFMNFWFWSFPQMASFSCSGLRNSFFFPCRNKHLLSFSASSFSFFCDPSQHWKPGADGKEASASASE